MKVLQTQFDDKRLSNAVATPTCSSCCCCCCCLVTTISSSTLLAQRIAKEGEKHQIANRHWLTVLAALFLPVAALLTYFAVWTLNFLLKDCGYSTSAGYASFGGSLYTTCTTPASGLAFPLMLITPFLVLFYLYSRVHIEKPARRALIITVLLVLAFAVEFFGGMMLILTGVGGALYLVAVPFLIGAIIMWYRRNIEHAAPDTGKPMFALDPPEDATMDNREEEPPQQNPPTADTW